METDCVINSVREDVCRFAPFDILERFEDRPWAMKVVQLIQTRKEWDLTENEWADIETELTEEKLKMDVGDEKGAEVYAKLGLKFLRSLRSPRPAPNTVSRATNLIDPDLVPGIYEFCTPRTDNLAISDVTVSVTARPGLPADIAERLLNPGEDFDDWCKLIGPEKVAKDELDLERLKKIISPEQLEEEPGDCVKDRLLLEDAELSLLPELTLSSFLLPFPVNDMTLVPIRSELDGHIVEFKEARKAVDELLKDRKLRSDPNWTDPSDLNSSPDDFFKAEWTPLKDEPLKPIVPNSREMETVLEKKENLREMIESEISDEKFEQILELKKEAEAVLVELVETERGPDHVENDGFEVFKKFDDPEKFLEDLDFKVLRKKDENVSYTPEKVVVEPTNPLDRIGQLKVVEPEYNPIVRKVEEGVDWKSILENADEEPEVIKDLIRDQINWTKEMEEACGDNRPDLCDCDEKIVETEKHLLQKWIEKHGTADGFGLPEEISFEEELSEAFKPITLEDYQEKFMEDHFFPDKRCEIDFGHLRTMLSLSTHFKEMAEIPITSEEGDSDFEKCTQILDELDKEGPKVVNEPFNVEFNLEDLAVDREDTMKWSKKLGAMFREDMEFLNSLIIDIPEPPKNRKRRKKCSNPAPLPNIDPPPGAERKFLHEPFLQQNYKKIWKNPPDITPLEEIDGKKVVAVQSGTWTPFTSFKSYEDVNGDEVLQLASNLLTDSTENPSRALLKKWIDEDASPSLAALDDLVQHGADPMAEDLLGTLESEESKDTTEPEELLEEPPTETPYEELLKKIPLLSLSTTKETVLTGCASSEDGWAVEVDTSIPPDMSSLGNPALTYPFELDNFQKHAIAALENKKNVFVAAHTSAGKTVVAEYAIAMSKRNRSRVIYTSPVKALSNQKFNDFNKTFDSVGLITGDLQLNDSADCLIMTTEILRSMLYNSSDRIRDLEFVIFDEVHYFNDPERGHVWEEALILLPETVQIVMLSATVPNTLEFASWIGRNKRRTVVVCKTQFRPVPLKHYLYVDAEFLKGGATAAEGKFLLKEGDSRIRSEAYETAAALLNQVKEKEADERERLVRKIKDGTLVKKKKGGGAAGSNVPSDPLNIRDVLKNNYMKRDQNRWISFIYYLRNSDWLPAVVFAFSRKKCDEIALRLGPKIDLTTEKEKAAVRGFVRSQVSKLDEVDRDLPQIKNMAAQLENGFGVHHSGILPILKEIVEILFQEGKVKILFATETFAMGVNMPARTVVFTSVEKFDGNDHRELLPAEYIQMAGRAGRRGKDLQGNVIIRCSEKLMRFSILESMLEGSPCKLTSQFRINYRMILNTLTTRGNITAERIMETSFCENMVQLKLMKNKEIIDKFSSTDVERIQSMKELLGPELNENLLRFYSAAESFITYFYTLRKCQIARNKLLPLLRPGCFVLLWGVAEINKLGVVLRVSRLKNEDVELKVFVHNSTRLWYNAMLPKDGEVAGTLREDDRWYKMISFFPEFRSPQPHSCGMGSFSIVTIRPTDILKIGASPLDLSENEVVAVMRDVNAASLHGHSGHSGSNARALSRALWSETEQVTYIAELNLCRDDYELHQLTYEVERLYVAVYNFGNVFGSMGGMIEKFEKVYRHERERKEVKELENVESENQLHSDYAAKLEVLKDLGYISKEEVIQTKGFMASKISKYELIVTELLTGNVLAELQPAEVAALLSFLVYQGRGGTTESKPTGEPKPDSETEITPALKRAIERIQDIRSTIVEKERQYNIREEHGSEGIGSINFELTPIMYDWANQMAFKDVISRSNQFQEGILVRWIQQLLESLKEVEAAAKIMGDQETPAKVHAAGLTIKRGIVFAPSLYTDLN